MKLFMSRLKPCPFCGKTPPAVNKRTILRKGKIMKKAFTLALLFLFSTPLMAQMPAPSKMGRASTERSVGFNPCTEDPYASGRPTDEVIRAYEACKTKTVPAVESQVSATVNAVKVAADNGEATEFDSQFAVNLIAITDRIQALERHVAAETGRIQESLQSINTKLIELNARPAIVRPQHQYTPPTVVPDYGTLPSVPEQRPGKWSNPDVTPDRDRY